MLKKITTLTFATAMMLTPAAFAGHKSVRVAPVNRIVVLADDLADAARDMRYQTERRLHGRRGRGNEVLWALERLEVGAVQFRRDVGHGASPRRVVASYDQLLVAFDRADRAMRWVRNGRLQREFNQVERAMQRLTRDVEIARGPQRRQRDRGVHGAIVLGDRIGNARVQVRIGF